MAALPLYIDTNRNALVAGTQLTATFDSNTFPLFYGDTVSLQVYLLQKNPSAATQPTQPYIIIDPATVGQLFLYIDDGTIAGTIYTQQLTWNVDAVNKNFYANLSLVTAPLLTLIGSGTGGNSAFLKIGYVVNGLQTTVFSGTVKIGVGLPTGNVPAVPAGQTALSMEVAAALFFPKKPVNGQPLKLASPNGIEFDIFVEDQADGTGRLAQAESN